MSTLHPLPEIAHHEKLPPGAQEIARVKEGPGINDVIVIVQYQKWLIFVIPSEFLGYHTTQFEVPLGFLSWFPQALDSFGKSPADGGLSAGKMASPEQNVEGEMLGIVRNMGDKDWPEKGPAPGYSVMNYSRPDGSYAALNHPSTLDLSEKLLFEDSLLDLIKRLGDRYKAGAL